MKFILGEGQFWTVDGNEVCWLQDGDKAVPLNKPAELRFAPRVRLIAEIIEPESAMEAGWNGEVPF
jgi:hypothetical protein